MSPRLERHIGAHQIALWILCFLSVTPAYAHNTLTHSGPVVNGLLHPLITPQHLLVLISYALALGLQRPLLMKLPIGVFLLAGTCALGLTLTGVTSEFPAWPFTVMTLATGLIAALSFQLPATTLAVLGGVVATLVGLDSGVEGQSLPGTLQMLIGTLLAMAIVGLEGAYYASLVERDWQRIGLRIAASWLSAISLLLLAFTFRR